MVRYSINIRGRVQGVGFRFFAQSIALQMGLTGWVKNLDDGSVQMEVQGRTDLVDLFSTRIREGNRFIRVDDMAARDCSLEQNEGNFRISY